MRRRLGLGGWRVGWVGGSEGLDGGVVWGGMGKELGRFCE